ncbi:DUF2510 domain-containing protein [Cryobacterium sp. PH31-L1]|uniref:DUF2510 domain-containing protein n=1 Tax=Cryobacterium sp. PH31-L1 TaxID=3046199 RepID=UPI0024BA4386|nr:DUF2510 domain-containing protein [Cryobacterium sp. PH31-L1]MDJ0376728.1 DUF2510 domain-containing protein [Cryobacterium sp. PH31-L1]
MDEIRAGWHPNPDGSLTERRWDGAVWTDETREYPPPATAPKSRATKAAAPSTRPLPKSAAFVAVIRRLPKWSWAAVALALIVAISVPIAIVNAKNPAGASDSAESIVKRSAVPFSAAPDAAVPTAAPVPVVSTPASPTIVPMGSPIVGENYSLVINSVDIVDQLETTSGGPIVADPGTQLVLIHSTISITGNAQDLTCGSTLFKLAFDSNGSKMADVFEGPRIPGNPQCNFKTSAGETVAWNFAYKIATGRTPVSMSISDTNVDGAYNWGEEVVAALH